MVESWPPVSQMMDKKKKKEKKEKKNRNRTRTYRHNIFEETNVKIVRKHIEIIFLNFEKSLVKVTREHEEKIFSKKPISRQQNNI